MENYYRMFGFDETSAFTSSKKAVVKLDGELNIIDATGKLMLPKEVLPVSAIEKIESEYCSLTYNEEGGNTAHKFYDFQTAHLHDSEWSVKNYLEEFKRKLSIEEGNSESNSPNANKTEESPNVVKWKESINKMIESGGIKGINYSLVRFGNNSNLVDANGALVFEEWIDSSSIQMCQGMPLIKNADNKWILFK